VDEQHYDFLSQIKWHLHHKKRKGRKYLDGHLPSRLCYTGEHMNISLHQLVMNLKYDQPIGDRTYSDYGMVIDHIDNDVTDNRCESLQYLTASENNKKKSKVGKLSKYTGVSFRKDRGTWRSYCDGGKGKQKHIGTFNTELEAKDARDDWLKAQTKKI
jgi:hypothetical protein